MSQGSNNRNFSVQYGHALEQQTVVSASFTYWHMLLEITRQHSLPSHHGPSADYVRPPTHVKRVHSFTINYIIVLCHLIPQIQPTLYLRWMARPLHLVLASLGALQNFNKQWLIRALI